MPYAHKNKKPRKRYIPLSLVHPVVKEAVDSREMGERFQIRKGGATGGIHHGQVTCKAAGGKYSAVIAIANECGIQEKVLLGIYRGKMYDNRKAGKGFRFTTVDKILSGLGLTHLWFEDPFSDYYNDNTF